MISDNTWFYLKYYPLCNLMNNPNIVLHLITEK